MDPENTKTCLVCKEQVLFEHCGCGGPYERALRMVTGAIMEGEASAVLEHAARRWLEKVEQVGHRPEARADSEALEGALEQWLKERGRHHGCDR